MFTQPASYNRSNYANKNNYTNAFQEPIFKSQSTSVGLMSNIFVWKLNVTFIDPYQVKMIKHTSLMVGTIDNNTPGVDSYMAFPL